jgi:hypothetical protein
MLPPKSFRLWKNCACNATAILFVLDASMKMKNFAGFAAIGVAIITAGCVHTVSDTSTPGVYSPDKSVSRYPRPFDDVYNATVQVVTHDGILITEHISHETTNEVRSVDGKVNGERVFIRVESVDPQITQITIQARTGAVGDSQLAHELDKEIMLQLTRE